MSIKQKHTLDLAWNVLFGCNIASGRAVTAGEFAKALGVARSTAQRRLRDMLAEDAICLYRIIGKNRADKFVYEVRNWSDHNAE